MSRELQSQSERVIPAVGSVGLYGQGLDLIPGSFGSPDESVTDAIARLQAKFRSLLAARLVKLTLNADSSRMNVSAVMKVVDPQTGEPIHVVAQEFTVRGGSGLQPAELNQAPVAIPSGVVELKPDRHEKFPILL